MQTSQAKYQGNNKWIIITAPKCFHQGSQARSLLGISGFMVLNHTTAICKGISLYHLIPCLGSLSRRCKSFLLSHGRGKICSNLGWWAVGMLGPWWRRIIPASASPCLGCAGASHLCKAFPIRRNLEPQGLKSQFFSLCAEVRQGPLLAWLSCGSWLCGVAEWDAEQALLLCVKERVCFFLEASSLKLSSESPFS